MINQEKEMEKTHSIVSTDSELRVNHIGKPVSYKGVDGWLIRYIPEIKSLMDLTLSEARECLDQNETKNKDT
jgi:hypothetical protein